MSESESGLPSLSCRARAALDRVGDKWSVYVITLLGGGTHRFSELKRNIGAITQRMLTVTLRGLERDGLITRTVYPTVPVRVEYSLTPLGASLLETLQELLDWSVKYVDEIDQARAQYDLVNAAENQQPSRTDAEAPGRVRREPASPRSPG